MLLDLRHQRPPRWEPDPRRPQLSRRQEMFLFWIVVANAVLLVLAPFAASSVINGLVALARHVVGDVP